MFQPLLRGLSTFVFVVGFLAGCTGAYALLFQDNVIRFLVLLSICVAAVIGAVKMREAAGELNLVGVTPEEIASNFEIPRALALGARAETGRTVLAGVAASAAIVGALTVAGLITMQGLWPTLLFLSVYGGLLALAKRRALKGRAFVVKNGRRYGAHRRLSVWILPTFTVLWLVASAPEADPTIVAIMAAGLLWWIGAPFHNVWELLHTTALVLMYGEHNTETVRWGLIEWLELTRSDVRVQDVTYDGAGEVTLRGEFDNEDELRRDITKLDFVHRVRLIPSSESASV